MPAILGVLSGAVLGILLSGFVMHASAEVGTLATLLGAVLGGITGTVAGRWELPALAQRVVAGTAAGFLVGLVGGIFWGQPNLVLAGGLSGGLTGIALHMKGERRAPPPIPRDERP